MNIDRVTSQMHGEHWTMPTVGLSEMPFPNNVGTVFLNISEVQQLVDSVVPPFSMNLNPVDKGGASQAPFG